MGKDTIVMLVPAFPANESETAWVPALQTFVKALARRNPDVAIHVVSFQYPYARGSYSWHGVTVHALAGRNRRFPLRFRTWVKAALLVRRLMRSHHVIALHSHWLAECTIVASWIARMSGTTHIATIHGQDARAGNPYLKHLRFDRMIITSGSGNAATSFFEATGRRVAHVIPIGLEPELLRAAPDAGERDIDILGVGSLTAIKDFGSFLEIVSELRSDYPQMRCVIIGEGAHRKMLDGYIAAHDLSDIVRRTGSLPRQQVLETMRRARILLHTAQYEGQGYVFLEALASGMRVVCRDVGYTGDGTGVFRCASNREMRDVLRQLLGTPFSRTQADVMSVDSTAGAYENLYGLTQS